MLNKVMIGRYYPIPSLIHRMNSVAKLLCLLLFAVMIFFANDIRLNLLLAVLLGLMLVNSKVPMALYMKTVWGMKWLLLFIFIINVIVGASLEGTIIMLLRIIYIILYSTLLTLTTPPSEITYGLEIIFSPLKLFKIPVNRMALTLTLALRFIPTIIDTGNTILKSQASRGIDYYNSNFQGKLLALKSLLIPMFVLTMKKADDLADSMEVRLYNVDRKRTNFRQNRWGLYDTFLVLIHVSLFVLIVVKGVVL